jgi:hypothetical protein
MEPTSAVDCRRSDHTIIAAVKQQLLAHRHDMRPAWIDLSI